MHSSWEQSSVLNLNSVNSGYGQWQVLIDDHNLPFIIGRRCERTNNPAQKRVLLVSDERRYLDFEVEKKFWKNADFEIAYLCLAYCDPPSTSQLTASRHPSDERKTFSTCRGIRFEVKQVYNPVSLDWIGTSTNHLLYCIVTEQWLQRHFSLIQAKPYFFATSSFSPCKALMRIGSRKLSLTGPPLILVLTAFFDFQSDGE